MLAARWIAAAGVLLVIAGCEPPESSSGSSSRTSKTVVKITASDDVCWSGRIGRTEKSGCGSVTVRSVKGRDGVVRVRLHKTAGSGRLSVKVLVRGKTVDSSAISSQSSVIIVDNRG